MSIMFDEMAKKPAAWLSSAGNESLVVLSTRVRLARNIAGSSFPESADVEGKKRIVSYTDSVVTRSKLMAEGQYVKAADISDLDKESLDVLREWIKKFDEKYPVVGRLRTPHSLSLIHI